MRPISNYLVELDRIDGDRADRDTSLRESTQRRLCFAAAELGLGTNVDFCARVVG